MEKRKGAKSTAVDMEASLPEPTPESGAELPTPRPPPPPPPRLNDKKNDKKADAQASTPRPPVIYYTTRTHSQIAQVVKELGRTAYRPKIAILASRAQYCINDAVRKGSADSIADACRARLREPENAKTSCQYRPPRAGVSSNGNAASKASRLRAAVLRAEEPVDIEDLNQLGKKHRSCPYFAAQELAREAELVFCPYNVLMDPTVRASMGIDLAGGVVVMDEAHNAEGICADAAGCECTLDRLEAAAAALQRALQAGAAGAAVGEGAAESGKPATAEGAVGAARAAYVSLECAVVDVCNWLRSRTFVAPSGEKGERVYAGAELVEQLGAAGLSLDAVTRLTEALATVRKTEEESERLRVNRRAQAGGAPSTQSSTGPGPVSSNLLEELGRLLGTAGLALGGGVSRIQSYRLAVTRDPHGGTNGAPVLSLCLWCLSPSVAFTQVSSEAHAVILASGTLAPLNSFASELGATFVRTVEANHVVPPENVCAVALASGPTGAALDASYAGTSSPRTLDEFGAALVRVCTSTHGGVLCFFASHAALERFTTRWEASGWMAKLRSLKHVAQEPRSSAGDGALNAVLTGHYGAVARSAAASASGARGALTGSLLLAVCRGRVSEGLDFTDENARAVVVIGVPFPNVKDPRVSLKRQYNDTRCRLAAGSAAAGSAQVLPGSQWYLQQAFRALNQAIGRCLRHRADWGAVVLMDTRFSEARVHEMLPKWLRARLACAPPNVQGCEMAMGRLEAFACGRRSVLGSWVPTREQLEKATSNEKAANAAAVRGGPPRKVQIQSRKRKQAPVSLSGGGGDSGGGAGGESGASAAVHVATGAPPAARLPFKPLPAAPARFVAKVDWHDDASHRM